ncbi:MAG: tol-pal system protein YbgF [Hyphomicrobiaceae bacterium]
MAVRDRNLMPGNMRVVLASGVAAAAVLLSLTAANAQQQQPQPLPSAQGRPPARGPATTTTPTTRPAETKGDSSQARGGDAQLRQRIEQLEEQLVDMQVVIGTLESLARAPAQTGSAAPAPRGGFAASDGADPARIDSLETQIRALTSQLEQLSDQVRQLGGRRTDAGGFGGRDVAGPAPRSDSGTSGGQFASREAPGGTPRSDTGGFRQSGPGGGAAGSFGSVTVTPSPDRDPIGRMITNDTDRTDQASAQQPSMSSGGSAKELYETAYGYLLQQDYGAAEVSFEEFLQRYPTDRLAADAQYWLGETLYVQRRYKPAAQAFLKVMQSYQGSAKVPNSLLKLAMTLEQLGQKDCALFNELETRHPNAAADLKSRARLVRQRVGC